MQFAFGCAASPLSSMQGVSKHFPDRGRCCMNHLHKNRDESMSCIGYFTGAHGANHFSLTEVPDQRQEVAYALQPLTTKAEDGQGQSSSDFSILHRPSIIRSSEERQTRYAAALTCEGGGVDRFIERVSYIVDREMAEPSDFDHDSFAASEFAAGLGGGR